MLAPKLRFKEFEDNWKELKLKDVSDRVTRKNINNETTLPLTISSLDGLVDQRIYFNKSIASKDMSRYYLLIKGEFAYNKSYSAGFNYGSIKRLDNYDKGALSTLYICFKLKKIINSDFIYKYFDSLKWNREVYKVCTEGARNHGLLNISPEDFFDIKLKLPDIREQEKIALFLNLLDKKIELQQRKIEVLKMYKKGLINEIFLDIDDYDIIGNVIEFEQPNKYIVSNANYEHKKTNDNIPVLTANKAFILGYTNEKEGIYKKGECVIFDDFTMESKYVDFEFKIKSSAIKILTAKGNNDMYYLFEAINTKKLVSNEHKRHYISIVQHLEIPVADLNTQCYISNLLRRYNKKLSVENEKLKELRILKTGLLQNMFI